MADILFTYTSSGSLQEQIGLFSENHAIFKGIDKQTAAKVTLLYGDGRTDSVLPIQKS